MAVIPTKGIDGAINHGGRGRMCRVSPQSPGSHRGLTGVTCAPQPPPHGGHQTGMALGSSRPTRVRTKPRWVTLCRVLGAPGGHAIPLSPKEAAAPLPPPTRDLDPNVWVPSSRSHLMSNWEHGGCKYSLIRPWQRLTFPVKVALRRG